MSWFFSTQDKFPKLSISLEFGDDQTSHSYIAVCSTHCKYNTIPGQVHKMQRDSPEIRNITFYPRSGSPRVIGVTELNEKTDSPISYFRQDGSKVKEDRLYRVNLHVENRQLTKSLRFAFIPPIDGTRIVVLGRDFLMQFGGCCFDKKNRAFRFGLPLTRRLANLGLRWFKQ